MAITASQVKELRERTGLGMMDCKKALQETDGDMDAAIDTLRKKAGSKVEKKAGRIAADGIVEIHIGDDNKSASMVEINSETDFVAKSDDFRNFASEVTSVVTPATAEDIDKLLSSMIGKETVSSKLEGLVARLGEKMSIRRATCFGSEKGVIAGYIHGRRIGVLVEMERGDLELCRDLAMHIAASKPEFILPEDVPADLVAKEREIYRAQAEESGKPDEIIIKMVEGRISKYLNEITLVGQPFVKDPDIRVGKLLDKANAKVNRFERFEVGEGMEKRDEDFAAEVMSQVKGE
ncbi:MAG TPA: elongation factor Ts [Desulfobacteraceae bacterium]|nr:elongation factor Ts [Desulfobacteraceae bacterium]